MAKKKNGKSKKIDPKVKATILSKLTLLGGFKDPINIAPRYKLRLEEKKNNVAVISFGRMNPPTIGHQKLVDKVKETARSRSGKPMIFLSHTQDSKKNPIGYNDKIRLARIAFGRDVIKPSRSKTIIQIAQELEGKYDDLVMIVGEDRVREFTSLLNKYNGKDYSFNNIEIISAGTRDPDSSDVSGMSASKMRGFVSSGDEDSFRKGLPFALQRQSNRVFDLVSKNLSESINTPKNYGPKSMTKGLVNLATIKRSSTEGSSAESDVRRRNPERRRTDGSVEMNNKIENLKYMIALQKQDKGQPIINPEALTPEQKRDLMYKMQKGGDVLFASASSAHATARNYLTKLPGTKALNKDTGYRDA